MSATQIQELLITFINGWKLVLVVFAASPLMNVKDYEDFNKIAQQSILNMRTIAALNHEETFKTRYKHSIAGLHRMVIRDTLIIAIGFGASQSFRFGVWVLTFWYGKLLDLDAEILVGKNIALVSPASCDKSTIISLFPRYYDVDSGTTNIAYGKNDVHKRRLLNESANIHNFVMSLPSEYDTPVCEKRIQLSARRNSMSINLKFKTYYY
ncbi:9700_t:CDS:2 [Ambispora leptoticha]|uniref:9700_t:CDS:1 n=1 Tax=Ambispora leptoticha TaxID=144679 RepID=A0A9N8VV93_9GLOM|nr:9700_t:CDS:2 [Ambispora leptoticha]